MGKKMFCFNPDGVSEWIVAETKEQAIDFYQTLTGGSLTEDYADEKKWDSELTWDDFLDDRVAEVDFDEVFTFHHEDGPQETKTIKEFLAEVTEVPNYFACSEN